MHTLAFILEDGCRGRGGESPETVTSTQLGLRDHAAVPGRVGL